MIPTLATADKAFICSYNIGSNIDHRKSLGVINEITTFTNEYIDGFCWIPVNGCVLNDQSYYWDAPEKDVVYVKVGVRCSADGYLHAWLLNTQKPSELILWNTSYNTTYYAVDDKTTLHWCIEKLYQMIFGNTTSFVLANIKFQKYIGSGSTRLYLFGSYSNSMTNPLSYTIDHPSNVQSSSISWYPNNYSITYADYLYSSLHSWGKSCNRSDLTTDSNYVAFSKAFLNDGGSYTDYTTQANTSGTDYCPLMPAVVVIGDAFYFGFDEQFNGVKLNIGTAAVGSGNIVWEYWCGSWSSLSVSDGTNNFTQVGENAVTFTRETNWSQSTVNGTSLYWIRARLDSGTYTTQPLLTQGWIRQPDYWIDFTAQAFGKLPEHPEPIFFLHTRDNAGSVLIDALCDPTASASKTFDACHITGQYTFTGTGNNSGRSYNLTEGTTVCTGKDYTDCGAGFSRQKLTVDMEPNRAYIWVPGYCSGASGGSQSECEANGGTWIPGHYTCDPTFTYDTSVSFTTGQWHSKTATTIAYANGKAYFRNLEYNSSYATHILCVYYTGLIYDNFDEYWSNELDQLKHVDFTILDTGAQTDKLLTIYTKHVAVGLLTDAAPTLNTYDWIVNSSGSDYFSIWQTPDGLTSRTPSGSNILYTRPITRHDEFNTVSGEPVLGGFLYEPSGSDGFLSRDPGVQDLHIKPVDFQTDFSFLYTSEYSSGSESRNIDPQRYYAPPVSLDTDFDFSYFLANPLGRPYAIAGSRVYTGHTYTVLYAIEQDTIQSYEGGCWNNLVIAGDIDSMGNVVPEVGSKLRVWKDGTWKSVPRVGDIVGSGVIGSASTIIFEGDLLGLESRFIEPQATGSA